MKNKLVIFVLVIIVFCSYFVSAVDINSHTVINESGSYDIISDIENGSILLDSSMGMLSNENAAILVNADDVIIDCGGHTFQSYNGGNDVAFAINDSDNVTVRNCELIEYYKFGIYGYSAGDVFVSNHTVKGSQNIAVRFYSSSGDVHASDLTVYDSDSTGIQLYNPSGGSLFVEDVVSHDNAGYGVYSQGMTSISGSTIYSNDESGFYLELGGSEPINVTDTVFYGHDGDYYDFEGVADMSGAPPLNFTNVTLKTSAGSSVGDVNLDLYLSAGGMFSSLISLRWAAANISDKPNSTYSYVDAKYLEMVGGATVDELVLSWSDSESSGDNESSYELWGRSDIWEDLTDSISTSENTVTATNVDTADVFFGDDPTYFTIFETSPLVGSSGGVPEFSTWTLLIGVMVIVGGFLAIRKQE